MNEVNDLEKKILQSLYYAAEEAMLTNVFLIKMKEKEVHTSKLKLKTEGYWARETADIRHKNALGRGNQIRAKERALDDEKDHGLNKKSLKLRNRMLKNRITRTRNNK